MLILTAAEFGNSAELTMDGEMQDTHKCKERAKTAANIIAEKYGWTKAEERENKRMERIHDAAMKVLKGMDAWDVETYFAGMRRNGFEVEPTYDSKGVCRGYSVGEKLYDLDGNYSSTVMYKASARGFGHGRDLTVSKLFGTWQKLHPEQEETRTESYHWQQNRQDEAIPQKPSRSSQSDDDDAYLGLLRIKRGVKAVMKGKFLVKSTHEAIEMLIDQQTLLGSIPLDAMRNNSSKLVNQDMDVAPLEEMNLYAECILRQVAENMHDSKLMSRYVEELTKKDREKWQQSQVCMAMMKGGETVCEYIEAKAEEHLIRLTSRMEWFPIAYHLADKVALVVFPILGYYTGKYHLNDTMTFLWAMAFMPIFVLSAIWGINELTAYLERRKKK